MSGIPARVGPYAHSRRVGDLIFVSGQPGIDPETGAPAGPTFGEQARQAFANLEAVLEAAGSRRDLVAGTTVLVTDIGFFGELNDVFGEFFAASPPTRMVMTVPLPPGLLISIGCVAAAA